MDNKLNGILSQGYGIIPKAFMRNKEISKNAKLIMAYFLSYTGAGKIECFPKIETITEDLGIARATFFKSIKELEALELLIKEKKFKNSPIQANKYIIKMLDFTHSSLSELPEATNVTPHSSPNECCILNNNNSNNNNLNNKLESKDSFVEASSTLPRTSKKVNKYREVFDYYMTLDLFKHKSYTATMTKAMKKAENDLNIDIEEMKRMLERHDNMVKATAHKGEYAIHKRTLVQFFSQKVKNSLELICEKYVDGGAYSEESQGSKNKIKFSNKIITREQQEADFLKQISED